MVLPPFCMTTTTYCYLALPRIKESVYHCNEYMKTKIYPRARAGDDEKMVLLHCDCEKHYYRSYRYDDRKCLRY